MPVTKCTPIEYTLLYISKILALETQFINGKFDFTEKSYLILFVDSALKFFFLRGRILKNNLYKIAFVSNFLNNKFT